LDDFPGYAGPDELGRLALEGAARLYSSSEMSVAFNVVIVFCWSREGAAAAALGLMFEVSWTDTGLLTC
jgi:hypothetical protein